MVTDIAVQDVEGPVTKLKAKDFNGKVDPDWCPGCGDFGEIGRASCRERV